MEDIIKFGLVIVTAFVSLTLQAPNAKRPQSPLSTKWSTKRASIAPLPNNPLAHPCNRVRMGTRRVFKVNIRNEIVLCHKQNDAELLSADTYPGSANQKFAATKIQKAIKNRANVFRVHFSKSDNQKVRVKRASSRAQMKPDETVLFNCVKRRTRDNDTGYGLPCGVCASIYRQPTPNRFPQYLNGVVCNPNENDTVYSDGRPIGKCVQKTITQELLEWNGKWEKDVVNSQRLNLTVYKQKWEPYDQIIHSSCVFQLLMD